MTSWHNKSSNSEWDDLPPNLSCFFFFKVKEYLIFWTISYTYTVYLPSVLLLHLDPPKCSCYLYSSSPHLKTVHQVQLVPSLCMWALGHPWNTGKHYHQPHSWGKMTSLHPAASGSSARVDSRFIFIMKIIPSSVWSICWPWFCAGNAIFCLLHCCCPLFGDDPWVWGDWCRCPN